MRPEAGPATSPASATDDAATLRAQQQAIAAWVRDPAGAPRPANVDPERLQVYRDLFRGNLAGLLAGNFPVIRRVLAPARWDALVDGFLREHDSRTPLFPEIAREFLRYLESRAGQGDDDPPWLRELAHYEWIELALQVSEARDDDAALSPDPGDDAARSRRLLDEAPVASALAWPLAYAWPVHRIAPGQLPDAPGEAPTLVVVQRIDDGSVRFHLPSPLAFRLLQRLDAEPGITGRAHLRALAAEAGMPDDAAFVDGAVAILLQWWQAGIVRGTRAVAIAG